MGKTNWRRMFLGGVVAGVVFIILEFATLVINLEQQWPPKIEYVGLSSWAITLSVRWMFLGILVVWLYSAIRPRYGAGPKTATIAGLTIWVLRFLLTIIWNYTYNISMINVLITSLVICVGGTLVGAWVYKEQV